jgi:hypothetical protein
VEGCLGPYSAGARLIVTVTFADVKPNAQGLIGF